MIGRVLLTLGLALGAALHFDVTGQVVAPAIAMLIAVVGTVVGPRLDLAQAAQALVLVGTALFTFALVVVDVPIDPDDGGPRLQYVVASGTALLTVGLRHFMNEPERGDLATWVIGLVAFYAGGRVASPLYLPLVAAYLGLAWMHAAWTSEAQRHRSRRHVLVAVGMIGGSVLVAGGTALGLRLAFQSTTQFISARVGAAEVGFGAGAFTLGSMDGMRSSNDVVLRVHGPSGDHFRGQVYREYLQGTWLPPGGRAESAPSGPEPTGVVTTIEFVSTDEERLFLPADAMAVGVTPSLVQVDLLGVPRSGGDPPEEVRFNTTGTRRLARAEPGPEDLRVPPPVAAAIGPLLDEWTVGLDDPRARIETIEDHLERDFTYSLHYDRDPEGDPVVQFMLDSRLGHCEYFASAMALSARQVGVPARVVTGFRSTERSPFSGHRIVRSRDAHAWTEVYLDGAWERVDPSPQNSTEAGTTQAWISGALDDLSLYWSRYGPQVAVGILLVVFVGLQIRTLLRGRDEKEEAATEAWVEGPPDWLLPVLERLAAAELVRDPAEPVEAFAERVAEAGRDDAGALLGRYAALRYGGRGDEASLARDAASLTGGSRSSR